MPLRHVASAGARRRFAGLWEDTAPDVVPKAPSHISSTTRFMHRLQGALE